MFPCKRCGLCCRNISKIPELKSFDLGNGVCKFLNDNLCEIYDTRPDICCVDVMYEKNYSLLYTKEEYYKLNMEGCKFLQMSFESGPDNI